MSDEHRIIFHVDMDAFYASVEQRENPEYRGRPVIVGAPPDRRGVVCAASYEARAFGVKSAMPSATAGKLCPKGVFIPPRMSLYREESKKVMSILRRFASRMEPMSVDEAYLDLSERVHGETHDEALFAAVEVGRSLKQLIRQERRLAASVGIASNKMLAKLASDFGKPDGLLLIPERDKVAFLRELPVKQIHGVGQVTEATLKRGGLERIGDLQDYRGDLRQIVGSWGESLKRYAFGIDDRPVCESHTVKSISSENTFGADTEDRQILRKTLRDQADEISVSLGKRRLRAKTIQVKVRYSNFETLTRQLSLDVPLAESHGIYRAACHLLARDQLVDRPLRLLGLGVSGLVPAEGAQLEFAFDATH